VISKKCLLSFKSLSPKNLLLSLDKSRAKILIINTLIIVILLNVIAANINFRFDLTGNKIHSLSKNTKQILGELDDIVTMEVFLSEQVPEQLIPIKNNLVWFIQNYEKSSSGNLKVKFLDPNKDPQALEKANQLGIPPMEFSTLKKDKFEVSRGYLALVVSYGDKNEIISALQDFPNLEYHLTSAVKKVSQEKLKTIAFSSGRGETDLSQVSLARQVLSQSYEWRATSFAEDEAKFNPEIDVLVINSPQDEFGREEKMIIDQYLQQQKGVLVLVDQYNVDNNLYPLKTNHNLGDLLQHYGIILKEEMVLDQSAALAGFRTEQGGIIVPYPYWIKITPSGFNRQLTPASSLETLTLMWASPLELEKEARWLIKTSPRSWQQETISSLAPNQELALPSEEKQKENFLAAIQTNPAPSFFSEEPSQEEKEKLQLSNWKENNDQGVKLAVVNDGDFIKDIFVQDHQGNLQFFLNVVDFLAQEKDLIAIRSKPIISRPIQPLSDQAKQIVKIANFLSPIVLATVTFFLIKTKRDGRLKKKTADYC